MTKPREEKERRRGFLRRAGHFAVPLAVGSGVSYLAFKHSPRVLNKIGLGHGASATKQRIGEFGAFMASDVGGTAAGMGLDRYLERRRKRKI